LIGWGLSSFTGWGVHGLNLALARARDADREEARARGARGAAKLAAMSWRETARQMKELVVSTRSA
jgi:hypothetical protein